MKLTQKYFDQQLENFQINISNETAWQTKELKTYIRRSFEIQRQYIETQLAKGYELLESRS